MKAIDITSYILLAIAWPLIIFCLMQMEWFVTLISYFFVKMSEIHLEQNLLLIPALVFFFLSAYLIKKYFIKPLTYRGLARRELSQWLGQQKNYSKIVLAIFTVIWAFVSLLAIASYGVGKRYFELEIISEQDKESLHGVLSSIAGAEATLVGIVIPVIFALVEQVFRNQDSFFKAFLYWSKVTMLIISSLLLVCFLFFQVSVPFKGTYFAFYMSIIWFCANVLWTAYLMVISIKFFIPSSRDELINKYLLQVILPNEVQNNYARALRSELDA